MRLRLHSRKPSVSNKGDTIVEVLISIAIVSSVLAGAFTVTQQSSHAVRDSQERAAMLQLLQGQVELVRALTVGDATSPIPIPTSAGQYFCIDPSFRSVQTYTGGRAPTNNLSVVPRLCKGVNGLYNMGISNNSGTFTFEGWWAKIGGGTNYMSLSYRIVPGS